MELRIGYFPVLDAALALRQAYDFVRFQPFNQAMEGIADRFTPNDKALIEEAVEATDGWLRVIDSLLEPDSAGLFGVEEGLLHLEQSGLSNLKSRVPESTLTKIRSLLSRTLRNGIAPEASRRARLLLDTSSAISQGISQAGVWDYMLSISDRVYRAKSGEYVFKVKPEIRVKETEVTRVIVMPSLVVSRRLAFWKSGSTLLLYVSNASPATVDDPPDSLLISALAVGDRTRLRMLRHLAEQPCTNLEMAEFLGVNPSTASRHFKLFKDAGFVELREGNGGRTEYELSPEVLSTALGAIVDFVKGGAK
jgi:DNA-binding transcriptional ArsR family regulator